METEIVFERKCIVLSPDGVRGDLSIAFYRPCQDHKYDGYKAKAFINSLFFEKEIQSFGDDAAQAFLWLPNLVVSYLMKKKDEKYIIYWLAEGDIDFLDFWLYKK